jgi:hypothetical protein
MVAPGAVLVLGVPVAVAVVASILTRRRPTGHQERDVAERLIAAAAAPSGEGTSSDGEQVDWGAVLRAELATITVPRERRRFALGGAVALLGRPHSRRSFVVAAASSTSCSVALAGLGRLGGASTEGRHHPPAARETVDEPVTAAASQHPGACAPNHVHRFWGCKVARRRA